MEDIPVEVWTALIGLIAGVVGVSVGAILQRRFERKHWERTIRLEAYEAFLVPLDEMFGLMREEVVDTQAVRLAQDQAVIRLGKLRLLGSRKAIHHAQNALFQMGLMRIVAEHVEKAGQEVDLRSQDFGDIMKQRGNFIAAARKDMKVRPRPVPTKVDLPRSDDDVLEDDFVDILDDDV